MRGRTGAERAIGGGLCARATRVLRRPSLDARSGDHPQRLRLISGQHAVYKLDSAQSDTTDAELTQGKTDKSEEPSS